MGFQGCNLLQSSLEWIVLFVKGNGSDRRRDRRHSLRFFSPLLGYVGQQSKRLHTFRILSRSRAFSRSHFTGRCVLHLQRTYSWPWRLARDIFGTFRTLRHTVNWSFLFPDDQCKYKWARNTVGSLCHCNLFIHNKTLKWSPIKHLILKLAHSEYYTEEQREPAAISIKL